MRTAAWVALVLLMAGCTAPSPREPLPEEWRGRDLREDGWVNETVQPGWTVVLEYDWSAGTRVAWDWFVFEPVRVRFQLVHNAQGQPPRGLVAFDDWEGKGERTIVQGGPHEIDWINEFPDPVTIAFHVPAGYNKALYPPGQGPGCVFTLQTATIQFAAARDMCLLSPAA